jgi:hypothetical protein
MFQFPGFASIRRWMTSVATGRVSPFGHRWITDCVRLPSAYRSLPRPSSPLCAQASPTRLRSLDHINCDEAEHAQMDRVIHFSFYEIAIYGACADGRGRRSTRSSSHDPLPVRSLAPTALLIPFTCQTAYIRLRRHSSRALNGNRPHRLTQAPGGQFLTAPPLRRARYHAVTSACGVWIADRPTRAE